MRASGGALGGHAGRVVALLEQQHVDAGLGEFTGDDGAARAGADHDHLGNLFDVARALRFGVHHASSAAPSSGTRSSGSW